MAVKKNNNLLSRAKALRKNMTPQERKLWYSFLRAYPVKFYKQRIIGPFIADFYCASAKLVIELDGWQHYETVGQDYDQKRDQYMKAQGLRVLRFSNREINEEFTAVCEAIDMAVQGQLPELD